MKKNDYLVNILLAVILALVVLGFLITKLILPMAALPAWNIPHLIILSVLALVAAEYLHPGAGYSWILADLLGGLTLALLPFAAGMIPPDRVVKLLIAGILVFLGCERMFRSVMDRLSSGPAGKLAPVSAGLTMCLLGQIFSGIFL